MQTNEILVPVENRIRLQGSLSTSPDSKALVIFSHGSGSSRFSRRNRYVAEKLNKQAIATLLIDLLTEEEDRIYKNRFDIDLLTERLIAVTDYMTSFPNLENKAIGYFGASTGAASALRAAAKLNQRIKAIVSRGGRPDLAGSALNEVKASTLLIIGGLDLDVIGLNKEAYHKLRCKKEWKIIEGASHLFEEPGKLDEVANLAIKWFEKHLIESVNIKKN